MSGQFVIVQCLRCGMRQGPNSPCGGPPTSVVDPPRSFTTKNNVIVNDTAFVNAPDSLGKHGYLFGLGGYVFYNSLETSIEIV